MAEYHGSPPGASYASFSGEYSAGNEYSVSTPVWLTGLRISRSSTTSSPTMALFRVDTGAMIAGTDMTVTTGSGTTVAAFAYYATPVALSTGVRYRLGAHWPDRTNAMSTYWTDNTSDYVTGPLTLYRYSYRDSVDLTTIDMPTTQSPIMWGLHLVVNDTDPPGTQTNTSTMFLPLFQQ